MRYIITGNAGYIGSYLNLKGDILYIDRKNGIDILDNFYGKFKSFNPDIIYHLAAQTSVIYSYKNPIQDAKDNILTTLEILKFKCKTIFTSTGAIYGDKLKVEETDIPQPQSPYAISKLTAENYIINSGLPYVILRLGNVYGRNNDKGVIKALKEGGKIFGDGNHTRDYIYIDDVIEALIQAEKWNGIYNIGTGKATSVNEIADLLNIKKQYTYPIREQNFISLNINKAKKNGWKPKLCLKKSILL